jgi:hypothetical protein
LNGCSFELEIMLGVCNSYGIPLWSNVMLWVLCQLET